MPQMAPLNWILLFIAFIFLMMIVVNKIYFLLEKKTLIKVSDEMKSDSKKIKWMW